MSAVADMIEEIEAQLKMVPELGSSVLRDPGAPLVSFPAVVIGPPQLQWTTVCADPDEMQLTLFLVVDADERALERLWDLVPLVAAAFDDMPDVVVVTASPGSLLSGGTVLPAYEIKIEVSL